LFEFNGEIYSRLAFYALLVFPFVGSSDMCDFGFVAGQLRIWFEFNGEIFLLSYGPHVKLSLWQFVLRFSAAFCACSVSAPAC
jgi:hypothetical protein